MDQDRFQTFEELRRSFNVSLDEMFAFTRQVRRLAELSDEDEAEGRHLPLHLRVHPVAADVLPPDVRGTSRGSRARTGPRHYERRLMVARLLTKDEVLELATKLLELAKLMTDRKHRLCTNCHTLYREGQYSSCYCDYESTEYD